MKKNIKFSTLVEIMILVPIFLFCTFVAIYWGEVSLVDINSAVSERYVSEMHYEVTEDELKEYLVTENVKNASQGGSINHYWANNDTLKIDEQDKKPGNWPVSETGSPHNVLHEYFIEYGFDINVNYSLVNGALVQEVSFSHPPGGLSLMQWNVYDSADDVAETLLQERLTYSKAKVSVQYQKDKMVPGDFQEIASNTEQKEAPSIQFDKSAKTTIALDQGISRDFLDEPTSIDRITSPEYDFISGPGKSLDDIRLPSNAQITNAGGGKSLQNAGNTDLYWNTNNLLSTRDSFYPLHPFIDGLDTGADEMKIDFEAMDQAYVDMEFSLDWANNLGSDIDQTVFKHIK